MSVYSSAIAERLNVVSSSDNPNLIKILRPARTTYSVARLGLLCPDERIRPEKQITATAKAPSPYGKGTYKFPRALLARLKSRAAATGKYQYAIVTEALEEYFDRSSPATPPLSQARKNNGCWHRLKRSLAARFMPVRRTMLSK